MTISRKTQQTNKVDPRQRILDAAFEAFTRHGFAQASTQEIASIAKVSKRDLYALVGKKEEVLVACISERATRLQWPEDIPQPQDRQGFTEALENFGHQLLREVTDPAVVSVFRLAIAEAERTPEIAHTLNTVGRAAARNTLSTLFTHAEATGIVRGNVAKMARQFSALLWGDLMLNLLLSAVERPSDATLKQMARQATVSFMQLNP